MKKNLLLLFGISLILLSSCEDNTPPPTPPPPPPEPPTAKIRQITTNAIIADKTNAQFASDSYGSIREYSWDFEGGLGTSSNSSASHTFNYEGIKKVSLTVSGPGGTNTTTKSIMVYAFDPTCNNRTNPSTHSTSRITSLQDNNLVKNGYIKFRNNYNVSIDLLLYSPTDWLNGRYTPSHRYTFSSGGEGILHMDGSPFLYSNSWGMRVQATNGVISCIRTVGVIADYNGFQYQLQGSDVLDGV